MMRKQQHLILAATIAALTGTAALAPAAWAAIPPPGANDSDAVPPAVAQLVANGQKAIKDGNIPLAVIQFKNASSAAPRNGKIRGQLGLLLLQSGDYYSAERELRQARKDGAADQTVLPGLFQVMLLRHEEKSILEEFPESAANRNPALAPDIFKAHAMALQALGQQDEAAAAMDKSLKLRRDVRGLLMRASIAQRQRDLPAAIGFAEEAGRMAPADASVMLFKFGLLVDARKLDEALAFSNEIVAKFPNNLPARFSRVEVLMQLNQIAKARAEVAQLAAKNPNAAAAVYYQALLMAREGKVKEAWRSAQSLPPQFLQLSSGIALRVSELAANAGAADTAAQILGGAISKYPKDNNLRLRLANIRLQQNNTAGALSALEPIRDSLDPASAQMLARVYVKAGQRGEALALLDKLDKAGKGNDATTLAMIGLEAQQGQTEAALKRLIQANAQKPTDPPLAAQLVAAFSRAGRFAEALAVADKLGTDPKQRPVALSLRGQVLLTQRNFDGAIDAYNKALALDPKSQVALYGRANVFEVTRKYAEANKDLRTALAINPKDMAVYLKLAEVAALQGNEQDARTVLSQAIKQDPQAAAPRLALARYLVLRKDQKGAMAAASELARMQPKNAEAIAVLGQVQSGMGQKQEAVATFRQLVELSPQSSVSHLLLGNALSISGDRAGAASSLKRAVTLDTKSPQVRAAQINVLIAQGDFDGAIASARAFQTLSPGSTADIMLGDTLAKAGRRDQAMTVYKQSFAARPDPVMLMRIVHAQMATGDQKAAVAGLSLWVMEHPKDTTIRAEYGTLLMAKGDKAGAVAQYEAVLKADPNNALTLNNLGWLKKDDDPKRALALVTRAAKIAPDMPEVLDTLAWIKLQQKQPEGTVPLLQRAHALRPGDGEITYHLVLALDANGQRDAARGMLKALLASKVRFEDLPAAQKLSASWR